VAAGAAAPLPFHEQQGDEEQEGDREHKQASEAARGDVVGAALGTSRQAGDAGLELWMVVGVFVEDLDRATGVRLKNLEPDALREVRGQGAGVHVGKEGRDAARGEDRPGEVGVRDVPEPGDRHDPVRSLFLHYSGRYGVVLTMRVFLQTGIIVAGS